MSDKKLCHLCERRAPRRSCPALDRDICAICCGTEREQSIGCPFDCEHLRDARYHEKLPDFDPKSLPNPEFELTESFMNAQQELALVTGRMLFVAAMETEGVVDADLRDALAALVTSFKSANSGLIYDARPANTIAAAVADRFREELDKFREVVAEKAPAHPVLDKDLLGVMVFWQRTEYQRSNGRRKGRAFMESLYGILPPPPEERTGDSAGIVTA